MQHVDSIFKCSYCPDKFIRHITRRHSKPVENETHVDTNSNNIPEKYDYCAKEYISVKARVKHEKIKHDVTSTKSIGTFPCPKCSKC